MAISDSHVGLATALGPIDLWVQSDRTLYARAGLEDCEAPAPLWISRGVLISFRGHYKLRDDGTVHCAQPFVHRLEQGRDKDPSSKMIQRAVSAIGDALEAFAKTSTGYGMLEAAGRVVREQEAHERDALAASLRNVAAHLEAEAVTLRAGGTVRQRTRRQRNGVTENVVRVQYAQGGLMGVCPEPPTVYGSSNAPADYFVSEEDR